MIITSKKLLVLAGLAASIGSAASQDAPESYPLHDDGLTDIVQWDHYSFKVNGERLFVFSGEFHPWRFPVPELWRDLLEKVKAAGFNAFSIYTSWAYHSSSADALDFTTGAHDFTSIMTIAKELGLYVIMRPGPYVNAETNAGGFPLWLTTGEYGSLRDSDDRYTAAWMPYWKEVSRLVKPHLVTNGGNVAIFQIENEFGSQWNNAANRVINPSTADYMQLLEDSARDSGIDVPLTHNSPNMNSDSWSKDFSNATGNVDVVGLDSYPSCWSCNLSECTGTNGAYVPYQVQDYGSYFTSQTPTQPRFMPEYQGGSYNPWGGPQGGCPNDIGADFANLFYRDLILQRVTAVSLYMLFGGTNWGWSACPVVASSYDYSSPVSENRAIGSKYYETKLLTHFTRVAKDLTYTERLGLGSNYTTNSAITAAELRNPENDAAFYVVRHGTSSSGTNETFKLHVHTSEGDLTIPRQGDIAINGHQAKIIVTDFSFGSKSLLYSTAEVLSYSIIDGKEVIALWLPEGESGEFSLKDGGSVKTSDKHPADYAVAKSAKGSITVSYTQTSGMSKIDFDGDTRVLLLDRTSAYRFWIPTLGNNPHAPENNTIMVQGPYLVRSATYDAKKGALHITGDADESTTMTVFGPSRVCSISWNGKKMSIKSRDGGMYVVSINGPKSFKLPTLGPWQYTDSLPEIASDYSPTSPAWVVANNTETPNPTKPADNNPVLYVDDYKIHVGNHIYRATFSSTDKPPTGVSLALTGGLAFGWSAWLNSKYIGSYYGLSYEGDSSTELSFANATLSDKEDNVLVVLMDNSGHDLRAGAITPRGIMNATLTGPSEKYTFDEWRIAGSAGREENIDPVRGPLNEGGLYAERVGMHLPGYSAHGWHKVPSSDKTITVPTAGVRMFRTVVPLSVPAGLDVSISFRLTSTSDGTFEPSDAAYSNRLRALLFVNGYQYGRFSPYIGNQIDFPVPVGILDYNGDNTIAVTVWSQSADGVEMQVEWNVEYAHSTSFDFGFDASELRPKWTKDRKQYA